MVIHYTELGVMVVLMVLLVVSSLLPFVRCYAENVSAGVPTTVSAQVSVCAPGAAPPIDGNTGRTLQANTAPVAAVKETARVVFGAESAAVHIASNSDEAAPQSANNSTLRVHWSSVCL